jgi:hypothetical protein
MNVDTGGEPKISSSPSNNEPPPPYLIYVY